MKLKSVGFPEFMDPFTGKHLIRTKAQVPERCGMQSVKVSELLFLQLKPIAGTGHRLFYSTLSECHKPNAIWRHTVDPHLMVNCIQESGSLTGTRRTKEDGWLNHKSSSFL